MNKLKLLLTFFLLYSYCATAINVELSKTYRVKDYEGYIQTWGVAKDHRNILYFANTYKILEYDGTYWQDVFIPEARIVRSIKNDKNGVVFVGTDNDLGYLEVNKYGQTEFISLKPLLDSSITFEEITKIICSDDKVYFYSQNRLLCYDYEKLYEIGNLDKRKYNQCIGIHKDKIYLGDMDDDIMQLEENNFVPCSKSHIFYNKRIYDMMSFNDSIILISSPKHGLFAYNVNTGSYHNNIIPVEVQNFAKKNRIYKICHIRDDIYAFGSILNGVLIARINTQINNNYISHFDTPLVTSIDYIDQILWLTTTNGIYKFEIDKAIKSVVPVSKVRYQINDMVNIGNDFYAATIVGLYKINMSKTKNEMQVIAQNPGTTSLCPHGKNEALVTGPNGLYNFKNKKLTPLMINNKHLSSEFYKVKRSKKYPHDFYVIGPYIFVHIRKTDSAWKIVKQIKDKSLLYFEEDSLGNIWIQKHNSLIRINSSGIRKEYKFNVDTGIKAKISLINGTPSYYYGKTLLSYNYSNDRWEHSTRFNHILTDNSDQFISIKEDEKKGIWILKQRYNYKNSLHYIPNKPNDYSFISNILPQIEISYLTGVYLKNDSLIYIATDNGILKLSTNYNYNYNQRPTMLIRSISFNDSLQFPFASSEKDYFNSKLKSHSTARHNIDIEYVSPYYAGEERMEYTSRLVGYDEKWSPWTTQTNVNYKKLPHGNYTFCVKARNVYGKESETRCISFSIPTPWYLGIPAKLFYLISIIGIIRMILILYAKNLRNQNKKLEHIIEKRTSELRDKNKMLEEMNKKIEKQKEYIRDQHSKVKHELEETLVHTEQLKQQNMLFQFKALTNQMNPHFIFNTLNQIQSSVSQEKLSLSNKLISRFSRLLRSVLEHSQYERIPLKDELEACINYLELEKLRHEDKFQYEVEIDPLLDTSFYSVPPLFIQPFVENSIHHGLLPKNEMGKLSVKVGEVDAQGISIHIEDNGIGRKQAGRVNKKIPGKKISLGTSLTMDRMKAFNGLYHENIQIQYTDLEGEQTGTRVEIIMHPKE
jgi:hypothetical protein